MTAPSTTTFPTAIDTWVNPQADDLLATPDVEHDLLHDAIQDAIRAIEAKLGIDNSPNSTTIDYIAAHHTHQGSDHSAKFAAIPIQMVASQSTPPIDIKTSVGTSVFTIDVTGVITTPLVASSLSLTTPLPIGSGGTGSATKNFVDLTTTQTVAGTKTFSSPLLGSAGSAAAPSHSFSAETGLGVYRVAAGVLGFAVPGGGWLSGRRPDGSEFFKVQQDGTIVGYNNISSSGRFAQSGGTAVTNYMQTNSGQLGSTTALNPGIAVFGGDGTNAVYGMDLGHDGTKFGTRIITGGSSNNIRFGYMAVPNPTLQSQFTSVATLDMATGLQVLVGSNPTLKLGPVGIPAIDFIGSSRTWRWASAYNDINSISLIDVTASNAQMLRVNSGGPLEVLTRLNITTGGLSVAGSPSGYSGSYGEITAAATAITTTAAAPGTMFFDHRGTANNGDWYWRNGTNGAFSCMNLSGVGGLSAVGQNHYFGPNALGGGGARLRLYADGATTTLIFAEGSGTDSLMALRPKGAGEIQIQDSAGNSALRVGFSNKLGFFTQAPQARGTITGSRGGNAALQSLLNNLNTYGLIVDGTTA